MDRTTVPPHISRLLRAILPVSLAALALLFVLGGISLAASSARLSNTPIVYDQTIADIILQVTTSTLEHELAGLTGERPVVVAGSVYTIATRHSYRAQAISMATRYAYEQFAEFGLAVTYHNYTRDGHQLRNVVAEKSGLTHPEDTYLVTAHIDDLPEGDSAPGADDNGSGSVAVLAAAQTLASHPFAHTIRFVLFTGEEQGLLGSDAYAADCAARGESIHGVVNLDMIGYNTGEPAFNLYARSGTYPGASGSRQLAEVFSNVVGLYNLNLAPHRIHNDTYPLRWGSDQWSFLNRGYPAILVIEDYAGYDFTPYYHTSNDRLDTLDLAFFRDLTRAAIATIAHLGHLLSSDSLGQLSGTVYEIGTARPLSGATVAASCSTGYYTFTTLTDASGLYSLSLPPKAYTLTTRTAAPGHYVSIVSNVVVITNHLTIQDIALDPWLRWYLPRIPYDP